jgi:RNA polymerase sigma factor (sigma-70 family)
MFGKAASCQIPWDFVFSDGLEENQQWILSAMQKHGQELATLLWRILGNEQDVCDAYQSTFLKLAHREDRCKPAYIKAYLFRTASNIAVSMLRRRLAERNRICSVAVTVQNVSSPVSEFDSKCLAESLRCCIAELPEHLRNVIVLRDLAELSYAQTARTLGISAATARVYRCKAVQLLAVWMNRER